MDKVLDVVTVYLDRLKEGSASQGMELWLRENQSGKPGASGVVLVPARCWVDHKRRTAQVDRVEVNEGGGSWKNKKKIVDDDRGWVVLLFMTRLLI